MTAFLVLFSNSATEVEKLKHVGKLTLWPYWEVIIQTQCSPLTKKINRKRLNELPFTDWYLNQMLEKLYEEEIEKIVHFSVQNQR